VQHDKAPLRRCAIYTRKSSEEGLEQDQLAACAARSLRFLHRVSRARAGVSSRRPTMTADSPAGPWSDRHWSVCWLISAAA
jgi:hypothetical protein